MKLLFFPVASATPSHIGRILLILVLLSCFGYGGAGLYFWANQRQLIFTPTRDEPLTPADLQLKYETVELPVAGQGMAHLDGWWLGADAASAPAFIFLHGNDQNISANLEHVARLRRMGFSVLVVDYRGYGRSSGGFPSEAQVYEDAETMWNYLIHERRVSPGQAFIYGHSLGGAIAIELALRHPEAAGLVVESTFTSMRDMARERLGYFWLPLNWGLDQQFDSLSKASRLQVPVLVIHGTADSEVPYAMSAKIFVAVPGPKEILLIPGAGHEDCAAVGSTQYANALTRLVENARRSR